MQTAQRRSEPGVIAQLFERPQRFEFFQAVRLLEQWLGPEQTLSDFLRCQNSLSLSFPASQIEALHVEPPDARAAADVRTVRMTPAFMGLLGVCGSLPAAYTERIAAQAMVARDDGPRAFLDTFSSRVLALFFEAWRKYRLELRYEQRGRDAFLPLLLALGGVGHDALRQRLNEAGEGVRDESLAHFCGVLMQRPIAAGTIARVLSDYFGVPIAIEQFVGHWYALPVAQQSQLGAANAVLGASSVVGERAWQRDLRLRLVAGPLGRAAFDDLLPGGPAARSLAKLLTMFTGLTLEFEIELVLRAADVHGVKLDSERSGGRLGWDSFLGATGCDRSDVHYVLNAV